MMTTRLQMSVMCTFTMVSALFAAPAAAAEGLFAWPGGVDLPPLGRSYETAATIAMQDDAGAVYQNKSCQVGPGDPWVSWGEPALGWVPAPALDGMTTLVVTPIDATSERVQILHVRCADVVSQGAQASIVEGADVVRPVMSVSGGGRMIVALPDGSVCQGVDAGLWCMRPPTPGPSGAVEAILRLDVTTFDGAASFVPIALPHDPRYASAPPDKWSVERVAGQPSGRVFFLASRQTTYYSDTSWHVVSARFAFVSDAPDEVVSLALPGVDQVSSMFWVPELGAIALAPMLFVDYAHVQVAVPGGDGAGNPIATDLGAKGAGILLIDHMGMGGGVGYLSLTDAIARRRVCNTRSFGGVTCESALGPGHAFPRPGGIGFTLPHTNYIEIGDVARDMRLYAVTWEATALDLDRDGLTAPEEEALGTSDWSSDSDGGGTPDHTEALLVGSDPADFHDDPWHASARPGLFALVESELVAGLRGWDITDPQLRHPETWSLEGPLCLGEQCIDADGAVVATYARETPGTKSADGTYLLVPGAAGWDRLTFADGVREAVIDRATVAALLPETVPGSRLRFVPIDRDTVFAVRESGSARVAVLRPGEPGEVVFDLAAERCASGLGPCDDHPAGPAYHDVPVHDVPRDELVLLGYVPQTRRLMIAVLGVWDIYVIAVSADDAPVMVLHGPDLGGLPGWIMPLGDGDLMSDGGVLDPTLAVRSTWFGVGVPRQNPSFMGAWGHTALRTSGFDIVEVVKVDPGIAPGDALVLRERLGNDGDRGRQLFVSKPRGGLVPIYEWTEQDLGTADGLDATADGRVCIADAGKGQLWELVAGRTGALDEVRVRAQVGAIRDCKYAADGALHLLFADPPRVEVRAGMRGDSVVTATLPAGSLPRALVRKTDGTFEVLMATEPVRGRLYTRAGRKVEMAAESLALTVDGVPVATLGSLWWINSQTNLPADYPGQIALAERADGVLLVGGTRAQPDVLYAMISRFWAIDPRTGRVAEPWRDTHFGHAAVAIAVVPGGLPVDPWSGRLVSDPAPTDPGVVRPVAPEPPLGGEATGPVAGEGEGCAGATTATWLAWLALFIGVWRAARRLPHDRPGPSGRAAILSR